MTAASATFDPNLARTRLRITTLDHWSELGVALAEKVVAEARRDLGEASRLLVRIAQAVRLAIFLARRLSDPFNPAFQPVPAKPRAPRPAASEPRPEAAHSEDKPAEKPARQGRGGFWEREVSDDAILRRPLKDIVKLICRTLGVVPDWSLWSEEDETPRRAQPTASARPRPLVAPPPDPIRAIPRPQPRPGSILDRPTKPPPFQRLRTRLAGACATGALIPTFPPIAPWRADASGCPAPSEPTLLSAAVSPASWRAKTPTVV